MEHMPIPAETGLARRVRLLAERRQLSHAIILTGHRDLPAAGRYLAAAMECAGEHPPCGRCGPCRKVLAGIHPDVTVVEDPEHKMISMDVLRRLRSDAYVLPNEGRRKVYIFPDCALLDRGDSLGLASFFTALEVGKISREDLQSLLEHTWELVGQSLLAASGCGGENLCPHLSRRQLSAAADLLREFAGQLRFNLGVGHVAGALAVELGRVAGPSPRL